MPETLLDNVRRFEVDVRAEAQALGLRASAALIAAVASLWLLGVTDSWLHRILAALGLLFAALWIRAAMKRAPSSAQDPDYVEIGRTALAIRQHGHTQTFPWTGVRCVTFDHDRLAITVEFVGSQPLLTLDAAYSAVGLQELAKHIDTAARSARQDASPENTATMASHE